MIDGNKVPDLNNYNLKAVIKGDQKVASISAASIIAKVTRDKFIITLAIDNKGYGWEHNFGYGTKQHLKAIKNLVSQSTTEKVSLQYLDIRYTISSYLFLGWHKSIQLIQSQVDPRILLESNNFIQNEF